MRRWNGWGDDTHQTELADFAKALIAELLGQTRPLPNASLQEVVQSVPQTRAPDHPLIDKSPEVRIKHAAGQSFSDWIQMRSGVFTNIPDAVAFPETSRQVRELMDWAARKDLILVPYGGGTSVAGHLACPVNDKPQITVALTRMNRMLDFDRESQIATFGAGVRGPDLEAQLAAIGYTLGHFPQSFELSTAGGWVVTRSSGQQSLRYGRIEQLFAGGTLETPNGTLEIPSIPASSAGPDLREIVLGSEGTLGILTEVKLRVTPLAEAEQFYTVFMPDWESGVAAIQAITQGRIPLSMMRLSNATETDVSLKLAVPENKLSKLNMLFKLRGLSEQKCMLTFGLTGSKKQVAANYKLANTFLKQHGGKRIFSAMLGDKWKEGRFKGPYLRDALWEHGVGADTFETAMDWSALRPYINVVEQNVSNALKAQGIPVFAFTHLSHVYPQGSSAYTTYLFPLASSYEETLQRWKIIKKIASDTVVAHGGTISHQHGVGRDHAPYLPAEKGKLGMSALKALSKSFDPDSRMNPGVLIADDTASTREQA
ncbi:putative FAD-linked oxidoreductase [Pseudovibrio axinellae]|uniref:Putative FAD-linked oxidoreductase n=1 Tax=Pseudovibrio axinellae TaxID=989403 RepID=A0A165T4K1_9HYPH|nr:FAD-binding oxidoreductase [Pseudovibrio axinellae]KZL05417.1 putative FAD-linked oxidoreductase [Pseudovibrio axinellae]SEQ00137.1 alkyldihydroxyacetonephosphate synthase [Pseudovibrio axinellae]